MLRNEAIMAQLIVVVGIGVIVVKLIIVNKLNSVPEYPGTNQRGIWWID